MEQEITLLTAFMAGLISFLSPCVLPMIPTYTALLAGDGMIRSWRFLYRTCCFFAGFTAVFVLMGATASLFGQLFQEHQEIIRKIGAVFMTIMGLHLLGIFSYSFLHREYRPLLTSTFQGPIGAFLLGIAFTAGWTPCTGPILASILIYAGTSASLLQGIGLLLVYSMGFIVPFLIMTVFLQQYFHKVKGIYAYLPVLQKCAGALLVIMGIILYFDMTQKILGFIVW